MPRTLATSAASSAQSVSRKRRRVRRPRPWPLWSKATTRNLVPSERNEGNQLRSDVAVQPWSKMRVAAPGGPSISRTNSRPSSGSSIQRPAGSVGSQRACSAGRSDIDADDTNCQHASGRAIADVVTDLGADQGRAQRRPGRHDVEAFTAFFDGADEVALDVVVTFVAHADDTPWLDGFGVDIGDDRGTLEQAAKVADAPFHLALLFLGGVIVAVFGEVTELARRLDLAGDFDATTGGEVGELGFEAVEGTLRQPMVLGHIGRLASSGGFPAGRVERRLGWTRSALYTEEMLCPLAPARPLVVIIR